MVGLLQEWLSKHAGCRPDSPVLDCPEHRLSYLELEEQSNRLAHVLRDRGAERGDRVCLLLPKSHPALVGTLGVLKADCAYVPVDLESPAPRSLKIIRASAPLFLLAEESSSDLLVQLIRSGNLEASVGIGWLGAADTVPKGVVCAFRREDIDAASFLPLKSANGPEDPSQILFTSGSTGEPKGVVLTHGNVISLIEWFAGHFRMDPSDRVAWSTPLSFDVSTSDIYSALAAGACLVPIPRRLGILPAAFAGYVRSQRITHWDALPSAMSLLARFDSLMDNDFPSMRRVFFGGEVLPTPVLTYWMRKMPHAQFTNLYGPTETGMFSSYYTLPAPPQDPKEIIPIGRPCRPDERLHVLDENRQPVPRGEIGEICIGGAGVSPGYWGDPDKTQKCFVPDPFESRGGARLYRTGDLGRLGNDGMLYFAGRSDSQIKTRGYRIELGEIEAAVHALDYVRDAAVVAVETPGIERVAICCGYVVASGREADESRLARDLCGSLPRYMLPSRWKLLNSLPLNPHGKIDRPVLRGLFQAQGEKEKGAGSLLYDSVAVYEGKRVEASRPTWQNSCCTEIEHVFRRVTDESRVDDYAPDILSWVYDSGNADLDLLFGNRREAHKQLAVWMKRPSSAFSIRCFTLLFVEERPLGGFIGISGKDLLARTRDDTLTLIRQTRGEKRAGLMNRLRRLRAAFPSVVEEDFYLRALGLAPQLRHKGLGPVLVARYLAEGERAGFSRFRLEVHSENIPAVRLYEKSGFHATAEAIEPESGNRVLTMVLERKASRAD